MSDPRAITLALGGRWFGRYGVAPCPACQPERHKGQSALTLSYSQDGRLLAHCKKSNCAFEDVLAAAGLRRGAYRPPDPAEQHRWEAASQAEARKRARQAEHLWREARPIAGSPAAAYLRGRGITCTLPDTLRFHPSCWHGATAERHPALVARVEGSDGFAVHRTYLGPNGAGKAAIAPTKAMLGPCQGGAVRLADGAGALVVAEGIETALSLLSGLLDGPATVWAALSTSGIKNLRLPAIPGQLILAADGDVAGHRAAHSLAERAHALGWEVALWPAPDGLDWNDVLQGRCLA